MSGAYGPFLTSSTCACMDVGCMWNQEPAICLPAAIIKPLPADCISVRKMVRGASRKEKKAYHKRSLEQVIEEPDALNVRSKPRTEKRKRSNDDDDAEPISARLSGRILKAAREQQQEVDEEELEEERGAREGQISAGALAAAMKRIADSDDDEVDDEEDHGFGLGLAGDNEGWFDADGAFNPLDGADVGISAEEERALAAFMGDTSTSDALSLDMLGLSAGGGSSGGGSSRGVDGVTAQAAGSAGKAALGDLIVQRLREKQSAQGLPAVPEAGAARAQPAVAPQSLDDKVVEVYRAVGQLLSRYTSGKVPKAFKIIPNLKNWEDILALTEPENWSVHAVFQATRLFVSNLNARLAQRFLALILLPRLRSEIRATHKLHFALFQALKKATYKPGAFFKGILLPLCASRTCTLREAVIVSSVLQKVSIPVLHSAAALLRLGEMEYCGTTSFFIRVLLDKKYALPYRVIDALVDHFIRFADDERTMPVVWHQTLLCFVQRYKDEIRSTDKDVLRKLCSAQHHKQVTPEVLRELDHGRGRENKRLLGAAGTAPMASAKPIGQNVTESVKNMPAVLMMEED